MHETKIFASKITGQFASAQGGQFGRRLHVKHHFYIIDDNGNVAYRIDSESSVAIRMNDSKLKYVLCLVKGETHFTYWQYLFNDDYIYAELKAAVLDILNENVEPNGTFNPGESDH